MGEEGDSSRRWYVSDKEAHVLLIAEALEDREKRPTHGMYDLTWDSKYLAVYTRKDRHIKVEGRGGGKWALIGGRIAAAYLPPQMQRHELARALGAMARAHTTIAEATIVERLEMDRDKVRAWLEEEEENKEGHAEWKMVGDPYEELRVLSKAWPRVLRICRGSKKWWKRQWKQLIRRARK